MIAYALLKPNGCIDLAGISRQPPPGYVVLPPGLTPEFAPLLMHQEGQWLPRPELPPVALTGAGFAIVDCPEGVTAEVFDAETGVLLGRAISEGGSLSVETPDPGGYRVELIAPEPFVAPEPFTYSVEEPHADPQE